MPRLADVLCAQAKLGVFNPAVEAAKLGAGSPQLRRHITSINCCTCLSSTFRVVLQLTHLRQQEPSRPWRRRTRTRTCCWIPERNQHLPIINVDPSVTVEDRLTLDLDLAQKKQERGSVGRRIAIVHSWLKREGGRIMPVKRRLQGIHPAPALASLKDELWCRIM